MPGWGITSIAALYTEQRYRRMGLGKRLVSHVVELILAEGHTPVYWTTPDNVASQGLAEGLGFRRYGTTVDYLWRKE